MEVGDNLASRQYYKYHDKFVRFYHDLYNKTVIYGIFYDNNNDSTLVTKFDDVEDYMSYVIPSIREQAFLTLLLPEFFSVMEGNFDFIHLLYTIKSRYEAFENLSVIISSNDLHILS